MSSDEGTMQYVAKTPSRWKLITTAVLAGVYAGFENAIDAVILKTRTIYDKNDLWIAPLAYSLVAYCACLLVYILWGIGCSIYVSIITQRAKNQEILKQAKIPQTIVLRPPRRMLGWAIGVGILASIFIYFLDWGYANFPFTIVQPLSNMHLVYLALVELGILFLWKHAAIAARDILSVLGTGLLIIVGTVMVALQKLPIDFLVIGGGAYLLIGGGQQIGWTIYRITSNRGAKIEAVNTITFSFWRIMCSTIWTTLMVLVLGSITKKMPNIVAALSSMQVPVGLGLFAIVSAYSDWLGKPIPLVDYPLVWILKILGSFIVTGAVIYLSMEDSNEKLKALWRWIATLVRRLITALRKKVIHLGGGGAEEA